MRQFIIFSALFIGIAFGLWAVVVPTALYIIYRLVYEEIKFNNDLPQWKSL